MLQGMELTRTNRSGGLTTYISRSNPRQRGGLHLRWYPPSGTRNERELEARREKVKAITLNRESQRHLFVSGLRGCNAIKNKRSPERDTDFSWTPSQPGFALRRFFSWWQH